MRKQLLAAFAAALIVGGGIAVADYIRVLDTHQVNAIHSINVGGGPPTATSGQVVATEFVGAVTGDITGDITGDVTGNADTATALAANGANCSAGSAPLGVDASGAAETCTDYEEDLSNSAGLLAALSDETGTGVAVFGTDPTITGASVTGVVPAEEIIAAAGTITADACGGIKRISTDDLGAVTTDTTNTFTAPAAGNAGCIMQVCNSGGTDAITLDDNALTELSGIAGGTPGDTVLGVADCVSVGSDGAVWRQLAAGSQN